MSESECWCALLTPAGRGAVATIAVVGDDAARRVDRLFAARSGRTVESTQVGSWLLGHWLPDRRLLGQQLAGYLEMPGEELIVARLSPDRVEIHGHGGPAAVAAVLNSLREAGCREVSGDQVGAACRAASAAATNATGQESGGLATSFPPGRRDLRRVDAACRAASAAATNATGQEPGGLPASIPPGWRALQAATTLTTAAILLDQCHGALLNSLRHVAELLDAQRVEAAGAQIDRLAARVPLGLHLVEPWQVVLTGRVNAGKSSLMNALIGFARAIVQAEPGTTRDALTARTAIQGWPVELVDTAGLRDTDDPIEREGVAKARERIAAADLILWVTAVDQPIPESEDAGSLGLLLTAVELGRVIRVASKCDLQPLDRLSRQGHDVATSVRTGQGIQELAQAIAGRLVPVPPAPGDAVPFTRELAQLVLDVSNAIRSGGIRQAQERLLEYE